MSTNYNVVTKWNFCRLSTPFSFESSAQIYMCHWDIVKAALCSCRFAISSLSFPISPHQMNDFGLTKKVLEIQTRASRPISHLRKTIWNWWSSGTVQFFRVFIAICHTRSSRPNVKFLWEGKEEWFFVDRPLDYRISFLARVLSSWQL